MKPTSIQHILSGVTNRFFGEDIVQTTKTIYPKFIYNEITFKNCKSNKERCQIIANHFNLTCRGVENRIYHNKQTISEIIEYYNRKYSCSENCSSKG